MTIDEIRELSLPEVQNRYTDYLRKQDLSPNTVQTSRTDAFYLYKNDSSIDFWELVYSHEFEVVAKEHLHATLSRLSNGNIEANLSGYMSHLRRLRRFLFSDVSSHVPDEVITPKRRDRMRTRVDIPHPSCAEVDKYLSAWDALENYRLQEAALNRLFIELAPHNKDISDILVKAATLNDFYSTNIFSIFPVAHHILSLDIDERLVSGDETLVDDIKNVVIGGKPKQFYSFATKYCSHHNPDAYPIYDSYVDEVLCYYRDLEEFSIFTKSDLKVYGHFKAILRDFQVHFSLERYSLKQLDQYLWQLGKEFFPKNYGKK
jgi:hypothetical protein